MDGDTPYVIQPESWLYWRRKEKRWSLRKMVIVLLTLFALFLLIVLGSN